MFFELTVKVWVLLAIFIAFVMVGSFTLAVGHLMHGEKAGLGFIVFGIATLILIVIIRYAPDGGRNSVYILLTAFIIASAYQILRTYLEIRRREKKPSSSR